MRLSEFLERIRPAGAPGAPTEGERQRRREAREEEIADVIAVLRELEAEADEIRAAGAREAAQVRAAGLAAARERRAAIPDLVAQAEATAHNELVDRHRDDARRIEGEAERVIAELDERATAEIPDLAAMTVEVLWDQMSTAAEGRP